MFIDYEICPLCGWEKPYSGECGNAYCGVTSEFFMAEHGGEDYVWAKRDGKTVPLCRLADVGDAVLWAAITRMIRAGEIA